MINSLSIKNFRSYKDVFVEFHPGVNVIIGANDSGKSNLLRTINLIVQNQPDGDDYISNWGGDMDIQLETGSKTVGRFRNAVWNKKEKIYKAGTENLYTLSGELEPFKAFGRGKVPEIIKDHLNISSLNINFQLDGPFLLGKSPADVARFYNGLVNLEVIDKTISNIASTLRKERTALKVEQELEVKKTKELKEFDWLLNAEKKLIALEKLNNYLKKLNSDWSDLSGLIKRLKDLEKLNKDLSEITKYGMHIDILLSKKEKIRGIEKDYIELSTLITNIETLSNKNNQLIDIVRHQNKINPLIEQSNQIEIITKAENELSEYIDRIKHCQEAEKQYKNIVKYADQTEALLVLDKEIEKDISEYNLLQESLEKRLTLEQEQENLKDKLEGLKEEFAELMPNQCPLCGK